MRLPAAQSTFKRNPLYIQQRINYNPHNLTQETGTGRNLGETSFDRLHFVVK